MEEKRHFSKTNGACWDLQQFINSRSKKIIWDNQGTEPLVCIAQQQKELLPIRKMQKGIAGPALILTF